LSGVNAEARPSAPTSVGPAPDASAASREDRADRRSAAIP
jgi:hypothetical protein